MGSAGTGVAHVCGHRGRLLVVRLHPLRHSPWRLAAAPVVGAIAPCASQSSFPGPKQVLWHQQQLVRRPLGHMHCRKTGQQSLPLRDNSRVTLPKIFNWIEVFWGSRARSVCFVDARPTR